MVLIKEHLRKKLQILKTIRWQNRVYAISALNKDGLAELLKELKVVVIKQRVKQAKLNQKIADQLPVITLSPEKTSWEVVVENGVYRVIGYKIERFASRTILVTINQSPELETFLKDRDFT